MALNSNENKYENINYLKSNIEKYMDNKFPYSKISIKILDSSEIAFDFWGASPHGLTILYITLIGIFFILAGVFAFLKRNGVTSFTRLSVHWALNKTEINNSKLFLWLSGIGVLG